MPKKKNNVFHQNKLIYKYRIMHISSDYKIIKLVHAFAMALQCCPNSLDWITEINKFKKEFGVIVWKVQVPH